MADDPKPSDFIAGLNLSNRTTKRLAANGIETAHDLMGLDKDTVMDWKQTGATVWSEIEKAQANLDPNSVEEEGKPTPAAEENWDPLLGPKPEKPAPAPAPEPEPTPKRSRNQKSEPQGDSVIGLIDWAIDAIAYDKEMARGHLVRAKKMLTG